MASGKSSQGHESSGLASRSREHSALDGHPDGTGKGKGKSANAAVTVPGPPPGAHPAPRAAGRPRVAATDDAILCAARELLAERGWEGMTLGDVATLAGVAKTTLYRRWSSKVELVVDAMAQLFDTLQPADTGNTRNDAEATINDLIALLARPETQAAVLALAEHAVRDPKMREAVREKIVDRQRYLVRSAAARAATRGEGRPHVAEPDLLFDIIVGTVFHRMLIAGESVDAVYLQRFLDVLLPGSARP